MALDVNVLELNFSFGFETFSTEILLTKLNVYWTFANQKLKTCLPCLQMLCCLPALLVGAVIGRFILYILLHLGFVLLLLP